MNNIEKLVQVMREQGAHNNPHAVETAVMKTDTEIDYKGLLLDKKDYLIPGGWYVEIEGHRYEVKLDLKAGDTVMIQYDESKPGYLVLGKAVAP